MKMGKGSSTKKQGGMPPCFVLKIPEKFSCFVDCLFVVL